MQWTRLLSTYPLHGFELEEEKDLGTPPFAFKEHKYNQQRPV